jgi:hypothetical protein
VSRLGGHTSLNSRYQLESTITGTDSYALIGVATQVPVTKNLSIDWSFDDAVHLSGGAKGYVGAAVGLSYRKAEDFRTSARYELRRKDDLQHILTLGGVGRLTSSVSMLARFRRADLGTSGGGAAEGQLAFAVRPPKSDRVAFLFSYDQGRSRGAELLGIQSGRRDQLSADAYILVAPKLESYTRVAAVWLPPISGLSRDTATYLQTRLQRSLTKRFDIAGEGRWVKESSAGPIETIGAAEFGAWLTRDFRVGLGYTSRGFVNPGSMMNSTATRGGPYFVISSRLAAIFDLMGGGDGN